PLDIEQVVGGACHQEEVGCGLGETQRDTFADAEARPGDEYGLAGQTLLEFGATEPEEGEKQPLHFPNPAEGRIERNRLLWPTKSGLSAVPCGRKPCS